MPRAGLTTIEFTSKIADRWGNAVDLGDAKYKTMKSSLAVTCYKHGHFRTTAERLLNGVGCWRCGVDQRSALKRLSQDEFLEKALKVHGDKYDYSLSIFETTMLPVVIGCRIHGRFTQTAADHLAGKGCAKCGGKLPSNTAAFIVQAIRMHGEKYDYSRVTYKKALAKVEIVCRSHGSFHQDAAAHLSGKGCGQCSNSVLGTLNRFVANATLIHGNRYGYGDCVYKGAKIPLKILCEVHGAFWQTPSNHVWQKSGCPHCSHQVSRAETRMLDCLAIPIEHRQVRIGKYIVDGFDPVERIVYELDGDYWHGNPEFYDKEAMHPEAKITFGELYRRTRAKRNFLEKSGYKVVSVWESDLEKFIQANTAQTCV